MKLDKGLKDFLEEAIREDKYCTVEGSFFRMLTNEEISYINGELKQYGYKVNCFECLTCYDYTDGREPYHIERDDIED